MDKNVETILGILEARISEIKWRSKYIDERYKYYFDLGHYDTAKTFSNVYWELQERYDELLNIRDRIKSAFD